MSRKIAVIGTAGGKPPQPMTHALWLRVLDDAKSRLDPSDEIYTGGAAWMDHIPVALLLEGWFTGSLSIWLAAPLVNPGVFVGPAKSAASASNFYHGQFSQVIGENTRQQILVAQTEGAWLNQEPEGPGYGAFFARNNKVAERAIDGCLAYTWGEGAEPADGGTKYTWDRIKGDRVHVSLRGLVL